MWIRTLARLAVILPLWWCSVATASEISRPFWTEQAMFRFDDELFFVGQGSCALTAEEGRQKAFDHGMQELRNYTQTARLDRLPISTQMTYEERNAPGCASDTVTVWRLLKVETAVVNALMQQPRTGGRSMSSHVSRSELPVTLRVGMSRDEVFECLGRPSAVTLRQDNTVTWEYRRLGLVVQFDRQLVVQFWIPLAAPTRRLGDVVGLPVDHRVTTTPLELLPTR